MLYYGIVQKRGTKIKDLMRLSSNFEIMGIRRQTVRIKNVQRENLNYGKEYVVDRKEVEYFVKHPFSPF